MRLCLPCLSASCRDHQVAAADGVNGSQAHFACQEARCVQVREEWALIQNFTLMAYTATLLALLRSTCERWEARKD